MISKDQILNDYSQKNYKPCFLLAWFKFLTYDEMEKTDTLYAYETALNNKTVKSINDWNKHVVEYTEDNIKYMLCISLHKALKNFNHEMISQSQIYADDIKCILSILNNNNIKLNNSQTKDDILTFYKNINNYYKFNLI